MLRRRPTTDLQPRRRRHRRERSGGQVIIVFAITFAAFLMGLIVMVVDLAQLYAYEAQVQKAAQDGAVAGAADVNLANFRSTGKVVLNGGWQTVCQQAITADLAGVNLSGGSVNPALWCTSPQPYSSKATVTIYNLHVMVPVMFPTATVSSTYSAFAQCGTTTAGATCD